MPGNDREVILMEVEAKGLRKRQDSPSVLPRRWRHLPSKVSWTRRTFRSFAEATKSDLKALAACVRGARQALTEAEVREINIPILIVMGTEDHVGGDPHALAVLFKRARTVHISGRDHNRTVGDKVYKASVLDFLDESP